MTIPIYQVDAFSKGPFTGNPAAVCPLSEWLEDDLMQKIALENNLSETAFFTKGNDSFHIRWFTPLMEVALCGHATLATAWIIFSEWGYTEKKIQFDSLSGPLFVSRKGDFLELDFPSDELSAIAAPDVLKRSLEADILECYKGKTDYMAVLNSLDEISALKPDFKEMKKLDGRGVLVTAKGNKDFDFVSRGFFPQTGIDEDPATGSAHTSLTPYWSKKLNKKKLKACQLSDRKGYFRCEDKGARILIAGECLTFLKGKIMI